MPAALQIKTLRACEISVRRPMGHGLCATHGGMYLAVYGRHIFLQHQDQRHHRLERSCVLKHMGPEVLIKCLPPVTLHLNFFFGSTCPRLPRADYTGVIQVHTAAPSSLGDP